MFGSFLPSAWSSTKAYSVEGADALMPSLEKRHSKLLGTGGLRCMKIRMFTTMAIYLGSMRRILRLLVVGALLGSTANGQETQTQPERLAYAADRANVPDAIAKVKSGEFAAVHVDMIANAGAVEAIPILKQQFVSVEDDAFAERAEKSCSSLSRPSPTNCRGCRLQSPRPAPWFCRQDRSGRRCRPCSQ